MRNDQVGLEACWCLAWTFIHDVVDFGVDDDVEDNVDNDEMDDDVDDDFVDDVMDNEVNYGIDDDIMQSGKPGTIRESNQASGVRKAH